MNKKKMMILFSAGLTLAACSENNSSSTSTEAGTPKRSMHQKSLMKATPIKGYKNMPSYLHHRFLNFADELSQVTTDSTIGVL